MPFCFISINKNNDIYSRIKILARSPIAPGGTAPTTTNPPVRTSAARSNGTRSGPSIGSAIVQTAAVGAIAVGGAFAIGDAVSLYNTRINMANQYQEQHEFPSDLTTTTEFYMSFLFQTYDKRSIKNSPFLRSRGTIRLPIPDNLKDNTAVTYSSKSLNLAAGAALEAVTGRDPQATIAGSTELNAIGAAITGAAQGLGTQATVNIANVLGVDDMAKAYTGITINPYQTILFERPEFKTHSFTWKFIPRNEVESDKIKQIVRTFQYHMLPGVSDGVGLFFSFPSMVTVSLFPSSEFLYRFKPCVVENISVNYSPGNTPSFYRFTNAPTAVSITVNLKEIEYWTNKDYTGNSFNDNAALNSQVAQTDQNARFNLQGQNQ